MDTCIFTLLVLIRVHVSATSTTLTGRGIGKYGVRLSSFCGPLVLTGTSTETGSAIVRVAFTMRSVHISVPIVPQTKPFSSDFLVNEDGMVSMPP